MARVTVGMPVFNGERFVGAALDSLLTQSFDDFDLLISDNASTDATEEICREVAARDRRVVYTRNESNIGAAGNLNLLLERATGEYFKWAAHDDMCRPDFLLRCVEALDADSSTVLAYTGAFQVDDYGSRTRDYRCGMDATAAQPSQRFGHILSRPAHWWLPIFGVMRRSAVGSALRHGNYPGGDHVFLAGLALNGPFTEIHEELFVHRQHNHRYTTRFRDASSWRDKLAFWDPDRADGAYRWWRMAGYRWVVAHSAIRRAEKWRCYTHIARWAADHKRGLAADLIRTASGLRTRPSDTRARSVG